MTPSIKRSLMRAAEIAGSRFALARALGISHQAIYRWTTVPIERAIEIERLTGVPRQELRPDIFGQPPDRAPSSAQRRSRPRRKP